MSTRSVWSMMVSVAAVLLPTATASGGDCLLHRSTIPGGLTQAVVRIASHAIYAVGPTLRIVDVSIVDSPRVVGELAFDEVPTSIEIVGGRVCVANSTGFLILDLSKPDDPTVAESLSLPGIGSFASKESFAFVATDSGLVVIDVADPANMVEVARYEIPGLYPASVAIAGDHLYVMAYDGISDCEVQAEGSLHIIDISSPASPHSAGVLRGIDHFHSCGWYVAGGSRVAASESAVYLTNSHEGFRVVDVSDPSSPHEIAHFPDMTPEHMAPVDHYLIVIDGYLSVFDVSTPASPVLVANLSLENYWDGGGLEVTGDTVLVSGTAFGKGFDIVDISQPDQPVELASLTTLSWPTDVAVANGYVFVTDGAYPDFMDHSRAPAWGLRIFDVIASDHPAEITTLLPNTFVDAVEVRKGFAYLGTTDALRVLDISNPLSPVEVIAFPFHRRIYEVHDMLLADDLLCIAVHGEQSGVYIFDVSNPLLPELRRFHELGAVSRALAHDGTFLYAAGYHELVKLDLSNPTHPIELSRSQLPGWAMGLAVSDGLTYVAGDGGLLIYDVSEPEVGPVGYFSTKPHRAYDVTLARDTAYVPTVGGLYVVDISDPAKPIELDHRDIGHLAVTASGSEVYVAGEGVAIFDHRQCLDRQMTESERLR